MGGLLTKEELAVELRCSERQIERLQLARKIPFVKLSGRMIRYRRESVLRALVKMETEAFG
jgi:excisionase family DNA binding protein